MEFSRKQYKDDLTGSSRCSPKLSMMKRKSPKKKVILHNRLNVSQ